jgi:hypothetical protein
VDTLIPGEFQPYLLRRALLPANVIGYVSTQFGAGYEYRSNESFSISTKRGSRRVEELLLEVPPRFRRSTEMIRVEGGGTFGHFTLAGSFPFRLGAAGRLRLIDIRVELGEWERTIEYAELESIRSADYWSESNAIARAKDELLVAIVDVHRARDTASADLLAYVNTYKPKQVLVLGDFQPEGRQRLNEIRNHLVQAGYLPAFVDEVPDIPHFDLMQKLVALASSSRFVVMDDSSKSGHLAEFPLVVQNRWYAVVLRLRGSRSSFMTHGVAATTNTMVEYEYDAASLPSIIADAVAEIETRIDYRERRLNAELPWRAGGNPSTSQEQ